MMKFDEDRLDNHAALVLCATELLSLLNPDQWLERYDAALASESDELLEIFCREAAGVLKDPQGAPGNHRAREAKPRRRTPVAAL